MSLAKTSIIWFRRDLRINDHPALLAAIESAEQVIPLFILDKMQIDEAGQKLLAYMGQSLRALDESLGNRLHIIEGIKSKYSKNSLQHMALKRFTYLPNMNAMAQNAMLELKRQESN